MTEAEWLACTDPQAMLDFIREPLHQPFEAHRVGASDRKLRLFACALAFQCARKPDEVAFAQKWAANIEEGNRYDFRDRGGPSAQAWVSRASAKGWTVHGVDRLGTAACSDLLRDIFGNPWRLAHGPHGWCKPEAMQSWLRWNDGTVPKIAQRMYDERDFADMPILADALEDAGCHNEEMLSHCRGMERCGGCVTTGPDKRYTILSFDERRYLTEPNYLASGDPSIRRAYAPCDECKGTGWHPLRGPHVRGCWAIDLLLGKE